MKTQRFHFNCTFLVTLITSLLIVSGTVFANSKPDTNRVLNGIITGKHRSEPHIIRNASRHPMETLQFLEVEPNMTVVEIWPGGSGWYTEILAPYLRKQGKLYAAHFSPNSSVKYFRDNLKKFEEKISVHPEIYDAITITSLDAPKETTLAPANSVDRVLTFRNVHNWLKQKDQGLSVFKGMYAALKPGGILGVIEHRAPESFTLKDMQESGYTTESLTIALAKKAGFELMGKSEINANPKDNKNYAKGVWTLPPSLRLKNKDREQYIAIGESDRMTLKFIKPKTDK
ncbi:MAG: methyltransferase [Pseudomonadales bacterium]|nr:methyltransferase [Pseudomonadales bacterium]